MDAVFIDHKFNALYENVLAMQFEGVCLLLKILPYVCICNSIRVAVVFGNNCTSNAGLVIVRGATLINSKYYIQQPVLLQINPICSSQMVLYSCNVMLTN